MKSRLVLWVLAIAISAGEQAVAASYPGIAHPVPRMYPMGTPASAAAIGTPDSPISAPASAPCSRLIAQTPPPSTIPTPLNPQTDTNPFLQPRPELQPLPANKPAPLPVPPLLTPPTNLPPPAEPRPDSQATVYVKQIEVLGSTIFSREELAAVVRPFERQNLTFEQLLEIRSAVTKLYVDRGYVTSGAFLPPQDDLTTGVIKIQVVEGELERVEVKGLKRLRDRYVRQRIELAAKTPLNLRKVESALQLLQLNPLFSSVQAELKAGTTPGRSVLVISLKELRAFHAAALVGNPDSPSVGSYRGSLIVSHDNLLGLGDRASVQLGLTSGVTDLDAGYALPINARDGIFRIRYERTTSEIVEPPFSALNINSTSATVSFGIHQPLVRTPTQEFSLGLSFDLRRSKTFLFRDLPFSFSLGADRGESTVRVLRFTQDWISRSPQSVLAARSQFSFGLPILGATQNEIGVDGAFFSWVGQFQWVQALNRDIVSIFRVTTQLTPDSLLSLEQFSIGGVDTVRGYRQNFRVGDNGVAASWEIRFPILQQAEGIGTVQLAPFVDVGKVWNSTTTIRAPQLLTSAGLGVRWQIGTAFTARLDWGIPLIPFDRPGNSLQDSGIVFSVFLQLL